MGVPEIAYIVEKLYNMIVYYSSQAALKEANRKELEARLAEVYGISNILKAYDSIVAFSD